jgi:hypothetical protein
MRCDYMRPADGPDLDVPVLDYVLLIALVLACLTPLLLLR